MKKIFLQLLILLLSASLLTACVTPPNQIPKDMRCDGIKRQMTVVQQNVRDTPLNMVELQSTELQQQYNAMNCGG